MEQTPKEYAEELVLKYIHVEDGYLTNFETAKLCSIIAVDEIIKEYDDIATFYRYGFNSEMIKARVNYLNEVKQEIEKL